VNSCRRSELNYCRHKVEMVSDEDFFVQKPMEM